MTFSDAFFIGALRVNIHGIIGTFNPFKHNGISHCYQLEQSISILRNVGWYFSFFFHILIEHSASKQWRP